MKQGWEYKKLGEVCSFVNDGDWIESKDQSESGIRLIQTGNIGNGEFKDKGERARYISNETYENLNCTEIFMGDCLVSRLPEPIGRCCILPQLENRCITAVDCSILRFKDDMIPQFFVYYSQSPQYAIDIVKKTTGTTRKRISRKNLEEVLIPYPPLSIQQSIVAELDEINNLIQLKKKELETFDKLAQSIFYEMFGDPVTNEKGWEVKKITEVCIDILAGGDASKHEIKTTKDEVFSIPVYSNGIEYEGLYGYSNHATISQPAITLSARGTIGAAFIRKKPYIPIIRLVSVIPNLVIIDLVYLYFLLKQTKWDNTGGTIPQLPVPKVKLLNIPLPPLALQQTFANRIEAIEQQKEQVKAAINKLETLLASRMQYWFD